MWRYSDRKNWSRCSGDICAVTFMSEHLSPFRPADEIGDLLGVDAGPRSWVRRRVMLLDGEPVQLADSYFPVAVAQGHRSPSPQTARWHHRNPRSLRTHGTWGRTGRCDGTRAEVPARVGCTVVVFAGQRLAAPLLPLPCKTVGNTARFRFTGARRRRSAYGHSTVMSAGNRGSIS